MNDKEDFKNNIRNVCLQCDIPEEHLEDLYCISNLIERKNMKKEFSAEKAGNALKNILDKLRNNV